MSLMLQARAGSLRAQFEELPIEADGSTRVPPGLRRAILNLALDILSVGRSRARRQAPLRFFGSRKT
jgi:hypothetical protein